MTILLSVVGLELFTDSVAKLNTRSEGPVFGVVSYHLANHSPLNQRVHNGVGSEGVRGEGVRRRSSKFVYWICIHFDNSFLKKKWLTKVQWIKEFKNNFWLYLSLVCFTIHSVFRALGGSGSPVEMELCKLVYDTYRQEVVHTLIWYDKCVQNKTRHHQARI